MCNIYQGSVVGKVDSAIQRIVIFLTPSEKHEKQWHKGY